jgi:predicted Zn-dependent peptidase
LQTAGVSVFVRVGSAHESRALNGIGHVLEHMAFKGTRERSAHRVNLDAEMLGAEVNAHTDKDHTAYHMRGLGEHAPRFVTMLSDIVRHATFPDDELAREREVLLQEVAEVEDDPVTVAYQLFDHACWATHPAAQPVIGQRRVIERCTREQLAAHVQQHYTGANVVVAAAGAIDAAAVLRAAEAAFGDLSRGRPNELPAAGYAGGIRVRRMDVGRQMHLVMGYPIAGRADADVAVDVAAAVLGDGMSSPLLAELREKRGLVYHAACNADRFEFGGQLAIEASFAPQHLDTVLGQVASLMRGQAERIEAVDLERARNQVIVRLLRADERVTQRLEDAALDLFALRRVRGVAERLARVREVSSEQVRAAFQRMLEAGTSVAVTDRRRRRTR